MTKAKLTAEIEDLKGALERKDFLLEEKDYIIAKLQKMLFGPTSEKQKKGEEVAVNQIDLFTAELSPEQIPTVKEVITYTRTKPVKKIPSKRVPLPVDLPRVPITIEPEEDTTGMVKIGAEITEVLDIIPPVFRVLQIIRPKYAHPQAATQDIEKPIIVAPMPSRVIDKGIPSARLLAYIIIGKFIQHLPYYRQIQIFQRIGVNIKSNTINGWIQRVCTLLKPLYDAFCQQQFAKSYLQADETTIKVLPDKKKGKNTAKSSNQTKNKAKTGYFWVYFDPKDKHVVFIYNPGRGRKYPAQDLKDFKGTLQTDGLSVYDAFDKLDTITLIACMTHIRRKFIDALSNDEARAQHVIDLIAQLYQVEETARENDYTPEQRYQLRQKIAKPVMTKLKDYLQKEYESGQVRPSSAIGRAIQYALGRWKYQVRYLDDGNIEIDNNLVENSIRPVAIGRKNYLFAGSETGARWAAIFYTLLGSALRHGHNPIDYLTDILHRLPDTKINELEQFFPDVWKAKKEPAEGLDLL